MMLKADQNPAVDQRHLFFAFTPFHHIIVTALVRRPEFSNHKVLIVNTASRNLLIDGIEVINFHAPSFTFFYRIKMYRDMAKKLRKLLQNRQISSLTSPHPHNVLSNALMLGPNNFPVNIYEDGTGSYCASENSGHLKIASRRKQRYAPLLGFHYRDYSGHFSGIEERQMNTGYFLQTGKVYRPDLFTKILSIDLILPGDRTDTITAGLVLFLDQDIEILFDKHTAHQLREKMYNYVNLLGGDVLVKRNQSLTGNVEINRFTGKVLEADPHEAAEMTALHHRPEFVVSFFSSALKNIKQFIPESRCIALGSMVLDSKRGSNLSQTLLDMSVEVI